ncbi:hypothetical protein evm_011469 [Chilo suppressalis]|nr:hypothetical protein evm_011469 [Chilo suppressalis]
MSPKYYWHCCDITLEDVRNFFDIALSSNVNYFYVIHILQGLVKEVNNYIAKNCAKKPFTMTEIYYAKVVLRHLMHTFLAVKWVKFHMKKELPPEVVVNFFLQWIDSDHMHPDAEVTVKWALWASAQGPVIDRWAPQIINTKSLVLVRSPNGGHRGPICPGPPIAELEDIFKLPRKEQGINMNDEYLTYLRFGNKVVDTYGRDLGRSNVSAN